MKKSYIIFAGLLFFALWFSPIQCNSQIQRSFWNLELGKTTKEEVKRFLSAKGYDYNQDAGGMDAIRIEDPYRLPLAGYSWDVWFCFSHGTLFQIMLTKSPVEFGSNGMIDLREDNESLYNSLKDKLSYKYSYAERVVISDSPYEFVLKDSKTSITLNFVEYSVYLIYSDRAILRSLQNGDDL